MEENRITIKDIAEELGISTATVSNVLHGKKNKVSKSTIEKVEACIERRNYIPSMAALLLGRNDSRIVAVIINDHEKYHGHVLEDGFVSASLNALSKALEEKGLFMMVKITKDITEVPTYASMWNMDALVLIGFCDSDYASLRRESRIPFVVYDGLCEMDDEEIAMLTVDNRKGGLLAGEYLYDMGHRSVLCITDNHWRMDEDRCNGVIEKVGKGEELMIPIDKENSGIKEIKASDIEIRFRINKNANILEKTQALLNMKTAQISPNVAIPTCKIFSDDQNAIAQSLDYYGDTFWKEEIASTAEPTKDIQQQTNDIQDTKETTKQKGL